MIIIGTPTAVDSLYCDRFTDTGMAWGNQYRIYEPTLRYEPTFSLNRGKTPAIAEFPAYPLSKLLTTKHYQHPLITRRQPLSISGFRGRVAKRRKS